MSPAFWSLIQGASSTPLAWSGVLLRSSFDKENLPSHLLTSCRMDHGKIKSHHPENAMANQSVQVFAWIATCAQVAFLEGTVIQGLIVLNDATYVPERWHGALLAWAVLALPLFCNIFARKILPPLEIIAGIGHFVFLVAIVTTLCVLSPRSSADFVFTQTITGLSGWRSSGIQWCVGLLSAAFPLGCASNSHSLN
jgi:hypothetical protein